MDQEKIKKVIEDIFIHTGCLISSLESNLDNGILWFEIETPDSRFMIGKDGETLKSLSHLIQRIIEKDSDLQKTQAIFIDINGYQKKKFEGLKNLAHMMAERARYFKSNIEIEPMPSYERRIIHLYLENAKNIVTESEGFGPNRKVIVKYVPDNLNI